MFVQETMMAAGIFGDLASQIQAAEFTPKDFYTVSHPFNGLLISTFALMVQMYVAVDVFMVVRKLSRCRFRCYS